MHVLNILWVVFGIGLMLVLNLRFKINSMVALLLAALSVGMLAGMDLMELLHTMKSGLAARWVNWRLSWYSGRSSVS